MRLEITQKSCIKRVLWNRGHLGAMTTANINHLPNLIFYLSISYSPLKFNLPPMKLLLKKKKRLSKNQDIPVIWHNQTNPGFCPITRYVNTPSEEVERTYKLELRVEFCWESPAWLYRSCTLSLRAFRPWEA